MYFGMCCVCVCVWKEEKKITECGGDVVVLVIINHIYNILEYSNIGLFISIRAAWAEALLWEPTAARVHVDLGAVLKHLQRHKEVRRRDIRLLIL